MRRRLAAIACGATLGMVAIAAGCGGSETVVTVTTSGGEGGSALPPLTGAPATTATPTTESTPTTASTPVTTAPAGDLADLLPPAEAMSDVAPGEIRQITGAGEMIDSLYQEGDPSKPVARARLTGAGFVEAVMRDHRGNGENSPVLFRAYVMRLGSENQARIEAQRSVQEIIDGGVLTTERVPVVASDEARGVRANGTQGGTRIWVEFLAVPRGPLIYGLQAVAGNRVALNSDMMQQIAQHVHDQPQP